MLNASCTDLEANRNSETVRTKAVLNLMVTFCKQKRKAQDKKNVSGQVSLKNAALFLPSLKLTKRISIIKALSSPAGKGNCCP